MDSMYMNEYDVLLEFHRRIISRDNRVYKFLW